MKKNEQRVCCKCNKQEVKSRQMCRACYSKFYRSTEKGKSALHAYNNGKGKDAQKKYREKNKSNITLNQNKKVVICVCGSVASLKGLCIKCYHRKYQREYYKKLTGKERKPKQSAVSKYSIVLDLVKNGLTISSALKRCKVCSGTFYKAITPIQKAELIAYKTIGKLGVDDYSQLELL